MWQLRGVLFFTALLNSSMAMAMAMTLLGLVGGALVTRLSASNTASVLFDFTQPVADSVASFKEVSDTARAVGMSKAVISIVESETVRHAVFMTLLNPQSDGACFAGVESDLSTSDWSAFQQMELNFRAQGQYDIFKVVLQDEESSTNSSLAFENLFQANVVYPAFQTINLRLADFKCSYRGKECLDKLDTFKITSFGLQAAGGVYGSVKQSGLASLEINTVTLV
jgi:hypothetical protein